MRIMLLIAGGALVASAAFAAGKDQIGAHGDQTLSTPAEFQKIRDRKARSVALFQEMSKIITSPRCMNCHPVDSSPRQGDDMHMHRPAVFRGAEDAGAPGLPCTTCHGAEPMKFVGTPGSIPGHKPWRVAPISMGWIGLSRGEICQQLKDPKRNGGRSLKDIVHHHSTDALVASAWHAGSVNRKPLPGNQQIFGELTKAWVESGAACPAA